MTDRKIDTYGQAPAPSKGTGQRFFDPMSCNLGRKKILLHSCCGPCSTSVIERLREDYDITVFYYNPCITDVEEYEKRKAEQVRYIDELNMRIAGNAGRIDFIEGKYDPEEFLKMTEGHEEDPEGGDRCHICFRQRLSKTCEYAAGHGYPIFTTTLTVSPHKNYDVIAEIGRELAAQQGIEFLDLDFKKKAGYQRSVQISKEFGLYRQDYCGCQYSKDHKE